MYRGKWKHISPCVDIDRCVFHYQLELEDKHSFKIIAKDGRQHLVNKFHFWNRHFNSEASFDSWATCFLLFFLVNFACTTVHFNYISKIIMRRNGRQCEHACIHAVLLDFSTFPPHD